jgi:WD40 repeat protein
MKLISKSRIISSVIVITLILSLTAPFATASDSVVKELPLVNSLEVRVQQVAADPTSRLLLMYGWDDGIYLYDIENGISKKLYERSSRSAQSDRYRFAFNSDGSLFAVTLNFTVGVYDGISGELIRRSGLNNEYLYDVAFTPDNNLVVLAHENTYVVDVTSQGFISGGDINESVLTKISGSRKNNGRIAQNPTNNNIAVYEVGGGLNSVRIFNGATGGSLRTISGDEYFGADFYTEIAYSPNGKYFVLSNSSVTVVFDAENNYNMIAELSEGENISFSANSELLLVGNKVYKSSDNFQSYIVVTERGYRGQVFNNRNLLTPDGKYIIHFTYQNGMRFLDASSLSIYLKELRLEPNNLYLTPNERLMLSLIGVNTDGSTVPLDITQARTSISNFSVARLEGTELIGLSTGTAHIDITFQGLTLRKEINVVAEKPSSWAVDNVIAAINSNLVPDALQSNYTQATTRAEFAFLAVTLYENIKGEITERVTFADTTDINVQKAAAIGVVTGIGNDRFNPDGQVTREQAAVMLARLADAVGEPLPSSAPTFSDNSQIASWAVDAVGQIQAAGIMGGTGDNRFSPQDPYTREQSIVTILRLYNIVR